VQTLALEGELDLANAATLAAELERAESDAAAITLDMRRLEFIDSTGIALLVSAHRRLNQAAERFQLVPSRSEAVKRVLGVTGVSAKLPFVSPDDGEDG
jgi:anti-sigma B factor antagonist